MNQEILAPRAPGQGERRVVGQGACERFESPIPGYPHLRERGLDLRRGLIHLGEPSQQNGLLAEDFKHGSEPFPNSRLGDDETLPDRRARQRAVLGEGARPAAQELLLQILIPEGRNNARPQAEWRLPGGRADNSFKFPREKYFWKVPRAVKNPSR